MSKKIKFRAWIIARNQYANVKKLIFDANGNRSKIICANPKGNKFIEGYTPNEVVLEQYQD